MTLSGLGTIQALPMSETDMRLRAMQQASNALFNLGLRAQFYEEAKTYEEKMRQQSYQAQQPILQQMTRMPGQPLPSSQQPPYICKDNPRVLFSRIPEIEE